MVKLFVGNLNPQSKAADLREKFESFGNVTECDIVNNYGFVHMETEEDADAAIAGLRDVVLDGVTINVERSHGKRTGGPGPMRRRFRGGPPEPFRGPPQRQMGGPPQRMGGYGRGYDDGYSGPYGPPSSNRGGPGYQEYPSPMNGNGRYPNDRSESGRHMPSRGYGREPLPPSSGSGYRGPPAQEPMPPRDYPPKSAPPRSSRDNERPPASNYDNNYDNGYYDYGSEQRATPSRYNYGRQ